LLRTFQTLSTYTPQDFDFQLEPFFLNSKSQMVEPMSASPNSTPRANKKPFGAIHKIVKIDEEIIQVFNKESDTVLKLRGSLHSWTVMSQDSKAL